MAAFEGSEQYLLKFGKITGKNNEVHAEYNFTKN